MMACYIRESLVTTQYIDLDDHRWSQALLPVRWSGRLGIRRVVSLAPSAYMASAASTACRARVVSSPDSIAGSR
jgi:hypothetical protein